MHPNLFGVDGFSMVVMIFLGVIAATALFFFCLYKNGVEKSSFLDLSVVIIVTVGVGIIFGILTENIYEAIKASINGLSPHWTWAMTFYGGLAGGVLAYLLMYRFYYLRHNPPVFKKMLVAAPGCLAIGHAFGRLGCFLSGCCYGITTGTSLDINFPGIGPHLPTQLIEMTFLLILGGILLIFSLKKSTNYTAVIYLFAYSVFRFVIEFFRGDERGQLAGLSPSQYWCILLFLGAGVLLYFYKKKVFVNNEI